MALAFLLHPFGTIHPRGSGLIVARSAVMAPLPDAVVWSPSNSEPNYQFSTSLLRASLSGKAAAGYVLARCTTPNSSGYFEVLVTSFSGGAGLMIGLTSSSQATNDWVGDANGVGYDPNGTVFRGGGSIATYATYTTADVIGVCRKGNFLYFSKNGVWQNSADPSAGTGGIDVSAFASDVLYPAISGNTNSVDVTACFTAASMAFAIPSGVTAWDGTSSSSSVTLALTGQSLSIAQGSLLASTTLALTGQETSVAQGSVGIGAALSGQSLSVAQGSVAEATSAALTGQSATAARGTVTPATAQALSGQSASVAQGALAPGNSEALSGQAMTVAQGSVTQFRSIALSGQGATLALGSLGAAISVALSGQALVVAQGSVVAINGITAALTGQSLSAAQGSVAAALSRALSGQSFVVSIGNVTVASSDVTASLTGQGISLGLGTIIATVVNGSPQLQDVHVNAENIVNEPPPLAGSLNLITEPSGQIVNHPPYPPAELA